MITARWTLSRGYNRQAWKDLLATRARFRRWSVSGAVSLITVGLVIALMSGFEQTGVRVALYSCAFGLAHLVWHYWDRARWLRMMMTAPSADGAVEVSFAPSGLSMRGPTSRGEVSWAGVEAVIRGRRGLIVVLQHGILIYVPFGAFQAAADADAVFRMHAEAGSTEAQLVAAR